MPAQIVTLNNHTYFSRSL